MGNLDREALDSSINDINHLVQNEQRWGRVEYGLEGIKKAVEALTIKVGEQNGRVTRGEAERAVLQQQVSDHFQEIKYTRPYERLHDLEKFRQEHEDFHKTRQDKRLGAKEVRSRDIATIGFVFGGIGWAAGPVIHIIGGLLK